jgi:hypothetical protein
MENEIGFDKILYLLKETYKRSEHFLFVEILTFSECVLENGGNAFGMPLWNLHIHTDYEIYLKYHSQVDSIAKSIKTNIEKISTLKIYTIKILPDYNKIAIINSEIKPVYTEWDEINIGQSKLIDLLKRSADSLDFQNIGNSSRTILQKVANIVFKPEKHTPKDTTIDVSPGKFKNQLHSYIKIELAGNEKKELRHFAEAAINNVEKAIDLANTLTHKLESEKVIAEVCIIGTISAISIVKLIEKKIAPPVHCSFRQIK